MGTILPVKASVDDAGEIRRIGNKAYICAYCSSAAVGQPMTISYDAAASTSHNPLAVAAATLAVYQYVGIALAAIATAGWYWFQIKGRCSARVTGNASMAAGTYLEVLNTADTFTLDSASARSVNSVGIIEAANTTVATALQTVNLFGDRVIIAAS